MRAALYCRLSSEDRDKRSESDESESIQNQKSMLMKYAAERGWEIAGVYSDDDYAGTDRSRPEFNRLLKDAEAHRFDVVLCKTQSRFTREIELVERYINTLFPIWGIRFVGIVDNADTAVKSNTKTRQINGLINEWYLQDLSENVRSVLKNKRMQGLFTGAFPLYGYVKDPERKGRLLIDPEAAEVVREVFRLYSEGMGKTAIARLLNRRGVPNPTAYKRGKGIDTGRPCASPLWRYSAIASMLTNEAYIGNMVQGRYGSESYKTRRNRPKPRSEWIMVEGTHEPIIERELWDRVQAVVKERAKPEKSTGMTGIFSKKARCAECGRFLRSSKPGGAGRGGRRYLVCPTRYADRNACSGACIAEDRLERYVLTELSRLTEEHLDLSELERRAEPDRGLSERRDEALKSAERCKRRIADCTNALRELYLDRAAGTVTEELFRELGGELITERERLETLLASERERLARMEEKLASEDLRERLDKLVHPERLTRAMTEALIESVSVGRRIPGSREVPVEIRWRF